MLWELIKFIHFGVNSGTEITEGKLIGEPYVIVMVENKLELKKDGKDKLVLKGKWQGYWSLKKINREYHLKAANGVTLEEIKNV